MKAIIYNIIIAAVCVVAIITLATGNFWSISVDLSMDSAQIAKFVEEGEKQPAEGGGENEISAEDVKAVLGDEKLELGMKVGFSSKTLLNSVASDNTTAVAGMLDEQVNNLIDQVVPFTKKIMKTAVKALVQTQITQAKEDVKAQYTEDKNMDEALEEKGIDPNGIMTDTEAAIDKIFDNDLNGAKAILIENIRELAEKSAGEETTQEEIDKQIDDFEKEFDESTKQFLDSEGNFTVENAVMVVLKESGLAENEGETSTDTTDVSVLVREKIMSGMSEDVKKAVGVGLKAMGIFLIIVIAGWAYLLVKMLLKLFMRNKTVKMTVPRLLGWIPHVFFVGLPMLIIKFGFSFAKEYIAKASPEIAEFLSSGISINIASLTWVSALCTVILLVISIPYRRVRREARGR